MLRVGGRYVLGGLVNPNADVTIDATLQTGTTSAQDGGTIGIVGDEVTLQGQRAEITNLDI